VGARAERAREYTKAATKHHTDGVAGSG
jgi:hypothetical protein